MSRSKYSVNCRWGQWISWAGLILALGCQQRADTASVRTGPGPNGPAAYGQLSTAPATNIARVRPPQTDDTGWRNAAFAVLQTELSPAIVVHSQGQHLNLFSDLKRYGLGSPSQIAWSTKDGPRTFPRGAEMDVTRMEENWVLAWFAGAEGWTNWDSPWAIFLQHHPTSMRLDDAGLHISFPDRVGDLAMLPLYGYYKPSPTRRDYLAEHGLPSKKLRTWEWTNGLPREPLMRLRYWAGATREIPIYCEDSFSVDRSKDSVTIRSRFDYHTIRDDWNTKPIRLAPLSPPLGLAVKLGGFPVQLSGKHFDFGLPTPFGPYLAIQGADTFDATFPVLQYVNEMEVVTIPGTNTPPQDRAAFVQFQAQVDEVLDRPSLRERGIFPGKDARAIAEAGERARLFPYAGEASRSNAIARLKGYLVEDFTDADSTGATNQYWLESPAICASLLETVWAYAQFSGDWEMVRNHWRLLRRLFQTGSGARWAKSGRGISTSVASEAAGCIAFARLAYHMGEIDGYNYGCALFAQELVLVFDKLRGAEYFRKEQPLHSLEFMDEEVFLTSLDAGELGWKIDGPKYPGTATRREFKDRWTTPQSGEIHRYFREYLSSDVDRELEWMLSRLTGTNGAPSHSPLESIGNRVWSVFKPKSKPESDPLRYARLIPGGPLSPFVAGPEREVAGPNTALVYVVEDSTKDPIYSKEQVTWPQPVWPAWKTPTGSSWSFGQIQPVRTSQPWNRRVLPLNWNTEVIIYDQP